jgi:hypothetical protein
MIKLICITASFKQVNLNEFYWTDDDFNLIKNPEGSIYILDYDYPDHVIGRYPKKYFISIAEWREKQINSILDDELN